MSGLLSLGWRRPGPSTSDSWTNWTLAIAGSGLIHVGSLWLVPPSPAAPLVPDWRDSVMVEIPEAPPPPPPAAEPEPEPEPEPELVPPPPEPEVVQAKDLAPDDLPEAPEAVETDAVADAAEVVQGLSEASFAEGGTTGLQLRAGTTLRASATRPGLDAPVARPEVLDWSDAPRRPRCRVPRVEVPESVVKAGLEGEVHVRFDIDADGGISAIRVVRGLSPEADSACAKAWAETRCKPARRGRTPVAVADMPHSCLFRALD